MMMMIFEVPKGLVRSWRPFWIDHAINTVLVNIGDKGNMRNSVYQQCTCGLRSAGTVMSNPMFHNIHDVYANYTYNIHKHQSSTSGVNLSLPVPSPFLIVDGEIDSDLQLHSLKKKGLNCWEIFIEYCFVLLEIITIGLDSDVGLTRHMTHTVEEMCIMYFLHSAVPFLHSLWLTQWLAIC